MPLCQGHLRLKMLYLSLLHTFPCAYARLNCVWAGFLMVTSGLALSSQLPGGLLKGQSFYFALVITRGAPASSPSADHRRPAQERPEALRAAQRRDC